MVTKKLIYAFFLLNVICIHAQTTLNKLDEKGNKNGSWTGVYEDTKNPKYEGTFDHGKEVGIFTFYDNTKVKTIVATRDFSATENCAYTTFYDKNKNKVSEGKVINKLFKGTWTYYHKGSKSIMATENYSNGKLDGKRIVYYPSGKIAEEMLYKEGLKSGLYKNYTESGIVIEESNYKNDEYDGLAIFRDADEGSIVSKGNFTNGKKTGIWQFFEKGKVVKEINLSLNQATAKVKKK